MEVKLFATLREGRDKVVRVDWFEGITGDKIIESLNIPLKSVAIFLVNGKNADRNAALLQSDEVSLFPPVGGG
ncbi:MAG: MoaD/ThiS family protein [Spirochaetes bacterium]|nr:MoaD/ThiS family protein [Spirochaetota bacterium]